MYYLVELEEDFELKVGAHTIYVQFVPSDNLELGSDNYGKWVPNKFTILIRNCSPYSMKLSTLLHEILHVLETVYVIDISHKDLNVAGDALAQILLDNFRADSPEDEESVGEGHGTNEAEQVANSDHNRS